MRRGSIISGSRTRSRWSAASRPTPSSLLQQRGHKVEIASAVARVFAIVVDDGWLQGGADGRSYGKAEGF